MVREFEVHPYTDYLNRKYGTYEGWVNGQGIPVYGGMFLEDVRTAQLGQWERKDGYGAFIRFSDQNLTDAYISEIPPAAELKPQKHLYEELIYILKGRGATSVWTGPSKKQTFEWEEGSLFAIPINTWHQHFNGAKEPARYFAVTNAPMVMDLFTNPRFVFENDFEFGERFQSEEEYFKHPGKYLDDVYGGLLETNFIHDLRALRLFPRESRGKGNRNLYIALAGSTMAAHISKFPVGTYKKAHRHGPGAHVLLLNSKGYTLMWQEGQEKQRFDWREGSVLSPPAGWYHQHFNTGKEPAMFIAFHPSHAVWENPRVTDEGQQIEFEDEDPEIRAIYERELSKEGIAIQMPVIGAARH